MFLFSSSSKLLSTLWLAAVAVSGQATTADVHDSSFDQHLEKFDLLSYHAAEEYEKRLAVFEKNLESIDQHNFKQGSWSQGVNQFTSFLPEEVPMGYVKSHGGSRLAEPATSTSRSRLAEPTTSTSRRLLTDTDFEAIVKGGTVPVNDLPKSVDWSTKGTPIKNQYYCGSCWAFASTAVIESHVAIATGTLYSLSEQQLVSCTTNPKNCGGSGGCGGATSQIAMEYVRTHGMVDEWAYGYESNHGKAVNCTLQSSVRRHFVKGAVVGIESFVTLPRNNYTAVMNAVAKLGPLAVAVACSPWVGYKSGIYSGGLSEKKETDLNHLVVLEGYGTDEETGEDYWLVRNSWGPTWGEHGYIRLKRVDPATVDDPRKTCGFDTTTADGLACTKDDDGNAIKPGPAYICGNSGVLYDVTLPLGAHLI